MKTPPQDDIRRFWSYVQKKGPDECWPWLLSFTHNGYGRFWLGQTTVRAHRLSYILKNGPIDDDLVVRHTCDRPPCCNPAHLLIGTQLDNVADRDQRGRTSRRPGETNPAAKLTAQQVLEIRAAVARGEVQWRIGERYGVTQSCVSMLNRKNWQHL